MCSLGKYMWYIYYNFEMIKPWRESLAEKNLSLSVCLTVCLSLSLYLNTFMKMPRAPFRRTDSVKYEERLIKYEIMGETLARLKFGDSLLLGNYWEIKVIFSLLFSSDLPGEWITRQNTVMRKWYAILYNESTVI